MCRRACIYGYIHVHIQAHILYIGGVLHVKTLIYSRSHINTFLYIRNFMQISRCDGVRKHFHVHIQVRLSYLGNGVLIFVNIFFYTYKHVYSTHAMSYISLDVMACLYTLIYSFTRTNMYII